MNTFKLYDVVASNLGHDYLSAACDLADNCLDAGATEIRCFLHQFGKKKSFDKFVLVDNGSGMNKETLIQSNVFSNDMDHDSGDMGKYGVGGTAASMTFGRKKTTITKQTVGGQEVWLKSVIDLDVSSPDFIRLDDVTDEDKKYLKGFTSGTAIVIESLRTRKDTKSFYSKLKRAFGETYSEKIKCGLSIEIAAFDNDIVIETKQGPMAESVAPYDNLYRSQHNFHRRPYKEVTLYSNKNDKKSPSIKMTLVNLNHDEMIKQGLKGEQKYDLSGIYWVRNDRLIAKATHGRSSRDLIKRIAEHNEIRVEIQFDSGLEDLGLIATNTQKNKITEIYDGFTDQIKHHIRLWKDASLADKRSRKAAAANTPEQKDAIKQMTQNILDTITSKRQTLQIPKTKTPSATTTNKQKQSVPVNSTSAGKKEYQRNPAKPAPLPFDVTYEEGGKYDPIYLHNIVDQRVMITIHTNTEWYTEVFSTFKPETQKQILLFINAQAITLAKFADSDEEYKMMESFVDELRKYMGTLGRHV